MVLKYIEAIRILPFIYGPMFGLGNAFKIQAVYNLTHLLLSALWCLFCTCTGFIFIQGMCSCLVPPSFSSDPVYNLVNAHSFSDHQRANSSKPTTVFSFHDLLYFWLLSFAGLKIKPATSGRKAPVFQRLPSCGGIPILMKPGMF